jgi:hypothetical protein
MVQMNQILFDKIDIFCGNYEGIDNNFLIIKFDEHFIAVDPKYAIKLAKAIEVQASILLGEPTK